MPTGVGAGQHPVLRLGVGATGPRCCPSRAQLGRPRRSCAGRPRAAADRMDDRLRHLPDYYSQLPEALHGRLGVAAADRDAERRRAALPGRPDAAAAAGQRRARTRWRRIWDRVPGDDRVPGHATGCRTRAGPASAGSSDFGGCRCQAFQLTGDASPHRPGLPPVSRPSPGRPGGGGRQHRPASRRSTADPPTAPGPPAGLGLPGGAS